MEDESRKTGTKITRKSDDDRNSELDWEDDDWEDEPEWFEPDDEPDSPWKTLLIFAGLAVLAAIICAVLWYFTHMNQAKEPADMSEAETTSVEETTSATVGQDTQPEEDKLSTEETSENPTTTPDTATPQPTDEATTQPTTETEPKADATGMTFTPLQDSVTAKDVTNLRSAPSTADSENVVGQLKNGEVLNRIAYNESAGWSKLEYGGQEVYAVTRYLTTDLNYTPPVTQSNPNRITTQDGRVIIFVDYDDYITPKEYVNLRTEPSTSQGEATVRCQVKNGTNLHRTGYSADSGWSRVDYNGEALYVVTNYVNGVVMEQ